MSVRKVVVGMAAVVAFALSASLAKAEEPLRIGIEAAYPPFSMKTESGDLTGFDIEIAWALCAAMERDCLLVEQDWDGMIPV